MGVRSAVGATAVVLAVAGAFAAAAPAAPGKAAVVDVTLKEWSVQTAARSAPAGRVTFVVRNAGSMKHEFVVIRSDAAAKALPMKGAQAAEVGSKGEIAEFAPGTTRKLTLTLAPGKYVLLCNLPGHYRAGQAVGFVVTGAGAATGAAQTSQLSVAAFEMGFKLSRTTVPHGKVTFTVRNDGKIPHDFSFGAALGKTPLLDAGQTATLTVNFAKPGKYTFICTVEGHQEAGMIGVLTVT